MWVGFDGRAYSREQWVAHVADTTIFPLAKMIVEHSTGIPTLAQWLAFNESDYIKNVQNYYETSLGWAHGPHLFASYKDIIGFSSLSVRGTHASCFNGESIGGECGINRNTEDWTSGPGKAALDNQHFAFAVLFVKMGLSPNVQTFIPHSACKADGHFQCPIADFEKYREQETASIVAFMNTLGTKLISNPSLAAQATPIYPVGTTPIAPSTLWVQKTLNRLKTVPPLKEDGDCGPATRAAIARFQSLHHLFQDGIVGSATMTALQNAVAVI